MLLDLNDPNAAIGLTCVLCGIPTFLTTAYRLWIRRSRYWADDLFVLFAISCSPLAGASTFVHIICTTNSPGAKRDIMIVAYYMMAATYYGVLWFSRLSMLFSIIRIHPEYGVGFRWKLSIRRPLYLVSGVFSIIMVVLLCQLVWVCEPENAKTRWKEMERPQCGLTRQVAITQVVVDVLSDLILVFIPLSLIRTLSAYSLRRRLAWIFSTAIITTITSIPHAAFIIKGMEHEEIITAYVQASVALIVCNLPVVATKLIKKWEDQLGEPKSETKSTWTSVQFASIALGSTSERRQADDVERDASQPNGTADSTPDTNTTSGVGSTTSLRSWLRWNRDLRDDEDPPSPTHPPSKRPATIDVSQTPHCEGSNLPSGSQYLSSSTRFIVTWS
ncbi:hypothetical protein AAF712_016346 [Marasmius tenuissimus]|uniref:Rhodopsin domain-containing protein n=1 Tax=Marasmius tenuissimus TaxID=585030 RepID=A0ABR2Z8B3_9AGAR|nr:hypothetical protein PM082_019643 [Marasmius tenuissimus]